MCPNLHTKLLCSTRCEICFADKLHLLVLFRIHTLPKKSLRTSILSLLWLDFFWQRHCNELSFLIITRQRLCIQKWNLLSPKSSSARLPMGQNRRDRDSFFSAQEIGDDSAECHLVPDWQKSLVSDLRRLKIGKNIAVLWKSVMPSVKANQILFDTMNICDIAETLTNWRILSILLKIAAHTVTRSKLLV